MSIEFKQKEWIFDLIKSRARVMMNLDWLKKTIPELDTYIDYYLNALVIQLENTMLGKQQIKKFPIEFVPKTWKDHFKQKHRFKWWMKRWLRKHPIKHRLINARITKHTIFPDFEVPHHLNHERYIILYTVELNG